MQPVDDARFREELVSFIPRLRAFGRTLAGQPASGDDLAQETVFRAWRARATFDGANMEAWLFRILRNQHISGLRRSGRAAESPLDDSIHQLSAPDDPGAGVALNDLRQALNRLPPEQREALILVGAAGCSYEDAAARAHCPVGTMKSRVFRARRTLAAYLEGGLSLRDALPADRALHALTAMGEAAPKTTGHTSTDAGRREPR